jgi:hypothetical protein
MRMPPDHLARRPEFGRKLPMGELDPPWLVRELQKPLSTPHIAARNATSSISLKGVGGIHAESREHNFGVRALWGGAEIHAVQQK